MPFILLFIGALFIVSGVRGKTGDLFTAIKFDTEKFGLLAIVLVGVGALGYIQPLNSLSRAFIVLILLAFLLNNKNTVFLKR